MIVSINDVPKFKKLKKLTFEDFKYLLLYCKLVSTMRDDFYKGRISFQEVMCKYDTLNHSEIFTSKRFYSILYSYAIMTESYCKTEPPYTVRKCKYPTSILEGKNQGFKFIEFFKFGLFWASISANNGDEFATLFDQATFSKESASEILGKSSTLSLGDGYISEFIEDCISCYKYTYPDRLQDRPPHIQILKI